MPEQADGRVLWEVLDMADAPDVRKYIDLIAERDELIERSRALKRGFARTAIGSDEFAAQQAEWKQSAERNAREIRAESRRLRNG